MGLHLVKDKQSFGLKTFIQTRDTRKTKQILEYVMEQTMIILECLLKNYIQYWSNYDPYNHWVGIQKKLFHKMLIPKTMYVVDR